MKHIFFIIGLFIAFNCSAQNYIENKITGQRAYSTGFDAVNNVVRWQINYKDSVLELGTIITCDTIADSLSCDTSYYSYKVAHVDTSGIIYVPDLWNDLDNMAVESNDVGKSGRKVLYNFGVGVILRRNLLNMDLNIWEYRNE